jgi:PAS domain S-box-containing protein
VREVSCKATCIIFEGLEEAGIATDGIAHGMGTAVDLRDPRARMDWDVFAEVLLRVEEACRGVMSLEELGARAHNVPSYNILRRAGQLVVSPRQLYDVAGRLVAPALFPNVIVKQEWLGSGRLIVTGELLHGYRESTAFFRVCHGNVAALPRLLNLPASIIEEQTVSGRRGRLVLRPPSSHTMLVRMARRARMLGALGEVWRGVTSQQRELEASIEAVRTSRHELHQLLERLPDGVLIHKDGIVKWANAALMEIFGAQTLEEILDHHILDYVPPEDREPLATAMRHAALNEVAGERHEYRVLRADGTQRLVQGGAAQLVHFHGEPARLVVLRDVTEERRLREQAAISDRLASIGALAAGVAHEINNPLAYVLLSLDMAARHVPPNAPFADLSTSLSLAREGTKRVIDIVRDLKMLSRVDNGWSEPVDLHSVLDATLALAERAVSAKARVVRSYEPVPPALGSRGKLGQVFLNLLSNAADAIPDGAPADHTIHVATRTDVLGRAVVEITDSGSGIPPEIAKRIFDPFFTTKAGVGTGLGLAMCHRIVTELGGEIAFESVAGSTTFRLLLPTARPG